MLLAHAAVGRAVCSGEKIASLDFARLDRRSTDRVELVLEGVGKTADSLEIQILFSSGSAKSAVAGSLFTYGEGPHNSQDNSGRFSPMNLTLDVTAAAQRFAGVSRVDVWIQLRDNAGREVKESLLLDRVELQQHSEA